MEPASFRPSPLRELNWRVTVGGLLLSLALHALLFQLLNGAPFSNAPGQQRIRVKLLHPPRQTATEAPQGHPPAPTARPLPVAPPPSPAKAPPPSSAPPRPDHSPALTAKPAAEPPAVTVPDPVPERLFTPKPAISPDRNPPRPAGLTADPQVTPPAEGPEQNIDVPSPAAASAPGPSPVAAPPSPSPGTPGDDQASDLQPPAYLRTPKPAYPQLAQKRGWQGTVLLKVFVDDQGSIDRAEVARSSGHEVLDRAALQQVRNWRFIPARRRGIAVGSEALVPVDFVLDGR